MFIIKKIVMLTAFLIISNNIKSIKKTNTVNATISIVKNAKNPDFKKIKNEKITLKKWINNNLKKGLTKEKIIDEYFKLPDEFKSLLIYNSKIQKKILKKILLKKEILFHKMKMKVKKILEIEDEIVNSEKDFIAEKNNI